MGPLSDGVLLLDWVSCLFLFDKAKGLQMLGLIIHGAAVVHTALWNPGTPSMLQEEVSSENVCTAES